MASTGGIMLGVVLAAGVAAVVTKPGPDSFAPALLRANAAPAVQIDDCADRVAQCAATLRQNPAAEIDETDYVVARRVTVSDPATGENECIGAFTQWWC